MSDVMLLGILRMPVNIETKTASDQLILSQLVSTCRQAADRIEADGAEIDRLKALNAELVEALKDLKGWANLSELHIQYGWLAKKVNDAIAKAEG